MSWRRIQYAKGANNGTISIVRFMYYVILENIRGDFSDNTAFQAFKLRIIFKNIGRSVRTAPFRARYPSPPPYDPTLVAKQQTMLKLSWNANKHRNMQAKLYRQLVCQFWKAFFFRWTLFLVLVGNGVTDWIARLSTWVGPYLSSWGNYGRLPKSSF